MSFLVDRHKKQWLASTFATADLLKFGLHKTRKAVRVQAVEPTSQAGGKQRAKLDHRATRPQAKRFFQRRKKPRRP